MATIREVQEGTLTQGPLEEIQWSIDTAPRGGDPSDPDCTLTDVTWPYHEVDVTNDFMTGAASISGNYIVSPIIAGLQPDRIYQLDAHYTQLSGGATAGKKSLFARIYCK